jgi:hypothetical protein
MSLLYPSGAAYEDRILQKQLPVRDELQRRSTSGNSRLRVRHAARQRLPRVVFDYVDFAMHARSVDLLGRQPEIIAISHDDCRPNQKKER